MDAFPKRKNIRLPSGAYEQGNAFFITMATAERYPWFQIHSSLAETLINLIKETAKNRNSILFAWCVMPDHFHILIQHTDIKYFVRLIKGKLTPLARKMEPAQKLWQRSFYDHALRKAEATKEVAQYIWKNPVRAGLVKRAGDYPWSGSLVWPDWRDFT
ncbi:MAG: REP-associated tyrosine transposase [Dissulfuribacterales bacterium]